MRRIATLMLKPVHNNQDGAILSMLIESRQKRRLRQIDLAVLLGRVKRPSLKWNEESGD